MIKKTLLKLNPTEVLILHLVLATISYTLAFLLRQDFTTDKIALHTLLITLPFAVAQKGLAVYYFRLNRGLWRFVGMNDLKRIIIATTVGSIVFTLGVLLINPTAVPRGVYAIDYILTILLFGGIRFVVRIIDEFFRPIRNKVESGKRVLIIGAGDLGEIALRMIKNDITTRAIIVGFLDDDLQKQNKSIHGYHILGEISDLVTIVEELEVEEVIIAISDADKKMILEMVESCAGHNIHFQILPTFKDFLTGQTQIQDMRNVNVEDLLGRDTVALDSTIVSDMIKDSCVLVTGAAGSIGSELCRQISSFMPKKLLLLDMAESPTFDIHNELKNKFPFLDALPIICDIKNENALDVIFHTHNPDYIFHAAAYKHVPLMEDYPEEAVLNNIFGTRNLVDIAKNYSVKRFVMISTDKAVRPTNIMGATKRCAELYVARCNSTTTKFMAVRFGNVLGSNGSVVPTFRKQIENGGPITVTHPDIERYFMTIPEAVELVLQSGTVGRAGDVFVLDMGKPVKIVELAKNMIELSGLIYGKDIDIKFTGLRPGEKMYEELVAYGENIDKTTIPKLSIMRPEKNIPEARLEMFNDNLDKLEQLAEDRDKNETVKLLWEIVQNNEPGLDITQTTSFKLATELSKKDNIAQ